MAIGQGVPHKVLQQPYPIAPHKGRSGRFGARYVTKPYGFIGFGAVEVTKPL